MRYLLDSNTFIESKRRYYGFDICPGFWEFLTEGMKEKMLFSIQAVKEELAEGNDDLHDWASEQDEKFDCFLKPDLNVIEAMRQVAEWTNAHQQYTDQAKNQFLDSADYMLVSAGLAHSMTIVTNELPAPQAKKIIKIPDACLAFHISYLSIFELLRKTQVKLILNR